MRRAPTRRIGGDRGAQMSTLIDLVLELVGAGIEPSSQRGLVVTFAVASVAFVSVTVWLVMTSPDPLRQPAWGLGFFVGSILVGSGGLFVSVLHLRRNHSDRLLALLCLTANVAAVAIPTFWIVAR